MKKIKKLSIILAYLFFVTLLPGNFMVDKVSAAEPKILNTNPYYVCFGIKYKDKTFFSGTESNLHMERNLPLTVMSNNTKKVICDDMRAEVLAHEGASYYLQRFESVGGKYVAHLYVLDAESNSLKLLKKNHVDEARKILKSKYPDAVDGTDVEVQYNESGKIWYVFSGRNEFTERNYCYIVNSDGYAVLKENYETIRSFRGNDGSLFVLQRTILSNGQPEYKAVHMSNDKIETEYLIDQEMMNGNNCSCMMGPQGELYFVQLTSNYSSPTKVEHQHSLIKAQLNEDAKKISISKKLVQSPYGICLSKDFNGKMWVAKEDGKKKSSEIFKMDNDSLVSKYSVKMTFMNFNIYDDDNLIAYGENEHAESVYAIIPHQEGGTETPGNAVNGNNNENDGTSSNASAGSNPAGSDSATDAGSKAGENLPETGSAVDTSALVALGVLSAVAGSALVLRRRNQIQ